MIYFIQHTDFIKIGYTKEIHKRLNQLQVSCPVKLKILGLIQGTCDDEAKYHNMFNHIHSHGEWFSANQDLIDFIDKQNTDLMWKYGFKEHESNEINILKECRKRENLSLEKLGLRLGVSKQSVQNMEKRALNGNITLGALVKAFQAMGYKYEYRAVKISH
jgi:DNA-binding XRE family transcriptional regulator